jgi:single-strand DNA-binding protein
MSNYLNCVCLFGCCGKDAEIRATGGGITVATFSLATNKSYKDAQGNWKDNATWHNVKGFGRVAEIARDQVKKGARVYVEGELTTEAWDDKQTGQKRSKTVIVANKLSVVPSAPSVSATAPTPTVPTAAARDALLQSTQITDQDIPF